jgi:hypothetical protein
MLTMDAAKVRSIAQASGVASDLDVQVKFSALYLNQPDALPSRTRQDEALFLCQALHDKAGISSPLYIQAGGVTIVETGFLGGCKRTN